MSIPFDAWARSVYRSSMAHALLGLTGEIPDWIVFDVRVPASQHRLHPGHGFLGWEEEIDRGAWSRIP